MSNGINSRQNEEMCIEKLAAQRKLHKDAGRLETLNFILAIAFPLIVATIQCFTSSWSWLRIVSYVISLFMVGVSVMISKESKRRKKLASYIQLSFDVYVFNMPWDKKLFGKQKNINAIIVKESQRILNNDKEKQKLFNWYPSIVDDMELEKGILNCQRENCRWDIGLRKRYRFISIILLAFSSTIIFVIGIVNNELVEELILRFVFLAPMAGWIVNTISGLSDDIDRLNELDDELSNLEKKKMSDLQRIEKLITDHRKCAIKIPDFFYDMFKRIDEDREHRIVKKEHDQ